MEILFKITENALISKIDLLHSVSENKADFALNFILIYCKLQEVVVVLGVVVFIILTLTILKVNNIQYAQNKRTIVKSRSTVEPGGRLSQRVPSSFNYSSFNFNNESTKAKFKQNSLLHYNRKSY